jgi:Icc-related predicted phosphoesterase
MIYSDSKCPHQINIINVQNLKYPPTKNRSGKTKGPNDIKTILTVKTDLVKVPTLITSDLHSHTEAVIDDISDIIDISKYQVIALGDMAGEMIFGSDGDPTPSYKRLNQLTTLHLVQGNHDLPPSNLDDLMNLKNSDGSMCYISDGEKITKTPNGNIGGVHGTISLKSHPYKKTPDHYYALIQNLFKWAKPSILLTHDTPEIPIVDLNGKTTNLIGKTGLFQMVTKYKPKIHMYGHCHHRYAFMYVKGVMFINADARIIIMEPL